MIKSVFNVLVTTLGMLFLIGKAQAQDIQYETFEDFRIPYIVDEKNKTRSYYSEDCTEAQIRNGECKPLRVYNSETAEEIKEDQGPAPAPEAKPTTPLRTQVTAPPFSEEDTITQAKTTCNTPECLAARQKEDDAKKQMTEICLQALPQHCQEIKNKKYTVCHPESGTWDTNTLGCLNGLLEGLFDVGKFIATAGRGIWNWMNDSEYRDEAADTLSFLYEDLQEAGWDGTREIFRSGIVREYDEFTQCLNAAGRYEYLCEGGIEMAAGYKIARFIGGFRKNWRRIRTVGRGVGRGARVIGRGGRAVGRGAGAVGTGVGARMKVVGDRIRIVKSMGRGVVALPLTAAQKLSQREGLRALLKQDGLININKLTGYQIGLLKRGQLKNRISFASLTDDQAIHLSKRQLQRIPLLEVEKMSSANLGRTLSRMSKQQFQALMNNPSNVQKMPLQALEANLQRMTAVHVPHVPADSFTKILPATFKKRMTAQKLMSLTDQQAKAVIGGPQYQTLSRTQRYIVDQVAKGQKSSIPNTRLARSNAAYRHDQLKKQAVTPQAKPSAPSGTGQKPGASSQAQRNTAGNQQAIQQKGQQPKTNRKQRRTQQSQSRKRNRN